MEENREFRTLNPAEADHEHYIVRDTFNDRIWRFEIGEENKIHELLNDENEGPTSATVHKVGKVIDLTGEMVPKKWLPKGWVKPQEPWTWID